MISMQRTEARLHEGCQVRLVHSSNDEVEEDEDNVDDELERKEMDPDEEEFVEMEAGEPHRLSEFAEGSCHRQVVKMLPFFLKT